jgi:cytochrome bd ubiquinol oxidase subunit I
MDPLLLARAQFAFTVAFHFIFPSITIGLALLVAISLTLRWRRRDEAWGRMAAFWTKLFALTFTVGVATGIVMEFQFGTNWSRYSTFVGDIFGPPLAAEGVFAFFLESTFLGLLLFGGTRVGDGLRAFAGWMVAIGSTLSGFWILVANSWMQTPAGYEIQGGKAVLTDFLAAVFNPSTLPRFFHTVASSWTAAAFIVTGVAAWWVLRGRHASVAARSIRLGLVVAFVGAGLMFVTGDNHARQVANTQAAKFAGMNGMYVTTTGAPLVVWSLPPTQDPANAVIGPELLVGNMLSFLAYGSFEAPVRGLEEFPTTDWPPVMATFLAYHNMVLLGSLMLLLMLAGVYLLWRRRLEQSRTWLRLAVLAIPLPLIAIQLGWATAELGRQPWIVYGVMPTASGTSTVVSATDLALSLALFGIVYTLLGILWLGMFVREVRHGPAPSPVPEPVLAPPPGLPAPEPGSVSHPLGTATGGR